MKPLTAVAAVAASGVLLFAPLSATAQDGVMTTDASGSVSETVAALSAAVEGAGAKVFAVIDHGAGARAVGADVGAMQLVIFGNPAMGTPVILDDPMAGLRLPLKVLVFEDAEGATHMAWDTPAAMLAGLDIPADAAYLEKMAGALTTLTNAAK